MLRILLFGLALVPLMIQSLHADPNYYLLSGGWNLSTFMLDIPQGLPKPTQHYRSGYGITAGIQVHPRNNVGVVTGVGYETRGSKWATPTGDMILKFDYLHLPVSLKLMMNPQSLVQPYISPGIDMAFLIASNKDGDKSLRDFSSFDLDISGAVGLHMPSGDNAAFVEIGYAHGLLNASGGDDGRTANNSNIKFRVGILKGW